MSLVESRVSSAAHFPTRPRPIVVVDTGIGNLGNVSRALQHVGGETAVSDDPSVVAGARCLLLPGVGAFRPPRERLAGPLEAALRAALDAGAWLLGICVGYQLLFSASEEHGSTKGLAFLPGYVRRLPEGVPLPHIGWNRLRNVASHPLLVGVPEGSAVYFVHSYAPAEVPEDLWLARCTHGTAFPAVAGQDRVFGTQFHPEKSGPLGLRLLANFLELAYGPATGH